MKILQKLKQAWINFQYKRGKVSRDDVEQALLPGRDLMLKSLPAGARSELRAILDQMDSFQSVADLGAFWSLGRELSVKIDQLSQRYDKNEVLKQFNDVQKLNYIAGVEAAGYRPAAARIWRFFANPAAVFTFFFEHHHACQAALEVWRTEVIHDGFRPVAASGVSDERIAQVDKILNQIDIWQLRLDLLRHYWAYGNALILVHRDAFNNPVRFELLVFDRCAPIYDKFEEKLLGWDVTTGHITVSYPKDRILHLKRSSLHRPEIGVPPLAPVVTDLEGCLGGSALNNTMFEKAGMVSTLIALEDPARARVGDKGLDRALKELRQEIMANFSGYKAGGTMMVSNYVKDVFKLSNMKDWDGAFLKFRSEVARTVATIMGVPLGKLNIPLLAQAQYEASSLKDKNDADFDKRIAAVMTDVDRFINQDMLKKTCGIHDVEIVANGRTSMTLQSARAGKVASETGPLFTLNEQRIKFYGQPPLPATEKIGRMYLDNSKNRDMTSSPPMFAGQDPLAGEADQMPEGEDDAFDSGNADS